MNTVLHILDCIKDKLFVPLFSINIGRSNYVAAFSVGCNKGPEMAIDVCSCVWIIE